MDFIDLNPIEHAKETQQEILETEVAHNIFIKEIQKPKDFLEKFPETERIIKENGFTEFDYVVLMNAERTEEWFRKRDEFYLRSIGKACYYTVHCYRLAVFIHELIHVYEFKLGEPIIRDSYTEEALQDEILYSYLNAHLMHSKNFKLSFDLKITS